MKELIQETKESLDQLERNLAQLVIGVVENSIENSVLAKVQTAIQFMESKVTQLSLTKESNINLLNKIGELSQTACDNLTEVMNESYCFKKEDGKVSESELSVTDSHQVRFARSNVAFYVSEIAEIVN